jgi:hypothetical protein
MPHVRSILVSLLVWVTSVASADAPKPAIDGLTASAASGKVSVALTLKNAFAQPETVEALQSGVPTTFTYVVEIFRDRPNWFDDSIAHSEIEVIAAFNSVTREYLLNYRRDRRLVRSETFSDLQALERAMTNIAERDLFDIGGRKPWKLKVRAKADLMRGWVMYVIPWELSTRWRETRVRVAAP